MAASGTSRGVRVASIAGVAMLVGTAGGVALALRTAPPDELVEAERRGERALPAGGPVTLAVRVEERDPYAAGPDSLGGVPPYPKAAPRRLTTSTPKIQGAPFPIAWFETLDSVDEVVTFYEQSYRAASVLHVAHRFSERLGYVGYLEAPSDGGSPVDGRLHLVTAAKQGGRTVVFVSAVAPTQLMAQLEGVPAEALFPPGARPTRVVDLSEGPERHQTLSALVEASSVDAVRSFYDRAFAEQGWSSAKEPEASEGQLALVATKGSLTQAVLLRPHGADVHVVVSLDALRPGGTP